MHPQRVTLAALSLLLLPASWAAATTTVSLDTSTSYQRINGWECTAWGMQDSEAFPNFRDRMFDDLVDSIGINRLRLEVRSGCENDADYWTQLQLGIIDYDTWRSLRYSTVNDNADSQDLNPAGFHFSEMDDAIQKLVLPIKQRVEANGEKLYINLNYVAFTGQIGAGLGYLHDDPAEYAEFILATFRHLESSYGWVPDAVEILLEPDNVSQWDGTLLGQAIVATGGRLAAEGWQPRIIAPSNTHMGNAISYFDDMIQVPGVAAYLEELCYHRYGGRTLANLQALSARATQHGLDTSMLEWWFDNSTYHVLHLDLDVGRNSAFQQYVVSGHFDIDDTDPANPTIQINSHSKFTRQYFHYVRAEAQRIDATSSDPLVEPLGFINADGRFVVVAKAEQGDDLSFDGLPPGTYGVSYTVSAAEWGVELPEVVLRSGEVLDATLPDTGVMTVYARWHNRLLRNDELTTLAPLSTPLASIFTGAGAGLDVVGGDGVPQEGEGTQLAAPGSEDDDDTYVEGLEPGDAEPEAAVCDDSSRPLVFYQLALPGASLSLVKGPGCTLRLHY